MRTILRSLYAVCASAWILLAALPAWGQRVQFPTMLAQQPGVYAAPTPMQPPLPPPTAPYQPGAAPLNPSTMAPPATTYAPPATAYPPPTVTPMGPPATTAPTLPAAPPPGAPTAPPTWDPYATPSGASPYSSTVPSPYVPAPPPYTGNAEPIYPDGLPTILPENWAQQAQAPMRFLQQTRLRGDWLAPIGGSSKLGVTEAELSATFAIPVRYNQAPVLITPGFGFHFWDGPVTTPTQPADLPPVTYDAYIDTGWQPQVTPWLAFNLGVRTGLYTDFHAVDNHSIRIMGRALGVITLTPTLQLAVGVVYLDRNLVKMLPAGGVIWTPNAESRWELLFPNPKISRHWRTFGTTDVWLYVSGEYGGGAWTIRRANGLNDDFDYNDIRVMLGAETFAQNGLHGNFEVGYVFDRQLVYRSGDPSRFDPAQTIMLRAGLAY